MKELANIGFVAIMKNAEYNRQQMHTNILELWLENGTGGITMDVRKKLVELIAQKVCDTWSESCDQWLPHDCGKCYANDCHISEIADYLIRHGVTVQELDGCEYCNEDSEGYRKMIGAFSITNPFHGNVWNIETCHCKPRQIYFCPMCGRKLPQPPKGEQP